MFLSILFQIRETYSDTSEMLQKAFDNEFMGWTQTYEWANR